MGLKIFAERGDLKFISDEKDIPVDFRLRVQVWQWSETNNIPVEYQGTLAGIDVWRVRDELHRNWFVLKWL